MTVWRKGSELTRRLGWLGVVFIGNVAGALVDTATDWDGALQSVDELLATDLEPGDRYSLEDSVILPLAARRELGDDWFAGHERLVQGLADPQRSAQLEIGRACIAWCRGDYDAAVRVGLAAAECRSPNVGDLHGLLSAFRGALWLRDLPGVRSLAERIEGDPSRTPFADAVRSTARGGLASLEERTADAVAHFQEAIRRWHETGYDWTAAETALDFAWAVGPQFPEARQAADEARAVFERLRANVYLERLDAVMAGAGSSSLAPIQPGAVAVSSAVPPAG